MAPSTLRARDVVAADVTVIDLSQSGVRIAADAALAVGEDISIGLAGVGTRRAFVAWAREGHYGCMFEKPLAPEEVSTAFTSASVVRLGNATQAQDASAATTKADFEHLYGRHSLWRLPLDAVIVILLYAVGLGVAAWLLLLRP